MGGGKGVSYLSLLITQRVLQAENIIESFCLKTKTSI